MEDYRFKLLAPPPQGSYVTQGISHYAVKVQTVMDVRTGGSPRIAAMGDNLPFFYILPYPDQNLRIMTIETKPTVLMGNVNF